MKLHIFVIVFTAALLAAACSSAPETGAPLATSAPELEAEQVVAEAPTQPAPETQVPELAENQPQEAESPAETEMPSEPEQQALPAGEVTFRIVPEESEARFLIDEVLLGSPFTVVGATNVLEGQVTADPSDPSSAQVVIAVDVRTLVTDNDRRNGAIQRWILETADTANQTAEFTAASISGVPEALAVGETFDFQITGDFSVKGVTKVLTFDGSATLVSEDRLEGTAMTETLYTEFTTIPSLPPQVASVEEDIILEVDFVAVAQ